MMKTILFILFLACIPSTGSTQTVLFEGAKAINLKDQTQVVIFPARDCGNCYYYIPANFRISFNESKEPEVSLLKVSESDNDPVTGGFLHTLFVWGLDTAQDAELQQLIRMNVDSLGVLMGATTVENDATVPGIKITGKDELAGIFRAGLKSSSGVATTPGSKMAMSFHFDEAQMKVLLEALKNPKLKTDAAFEITLLVSVRSQWTAQEIPVQLQVPFKDLITYIR